MAENRTARPIAPGTRIGHVHLKVADLDRALAFYCGVLGFELMQRYGQARGVHIGRRLPSPHRAQHLGEPRRAAAAAGHDRPLPSGDSLPDSRAISPTRCAGCGRGRHPARRRRDHGVSEALYLAIPMATGSSSIGTARRRNGPAARRRARDGDAPSRSRTAAGGGLGIGSGLISSSPDRWRSP